MALVKREILTNLEVLYTKLVLKSVLVLQKKMLFKIRRFLP